MKAILIGALTAATLVLPVAALAATYQYVNVQGNLETETADNAAQALTQPTDRDPNSGVILVTNDPVVTTTTVPATVGTYTDILTGVGTTPRTMYLTLANDGTVVVSTLYTDSTPPMIETGTWAQTGTNQITVTLTGNQTESYETPVILVFSQNGNELIGTSYSSSLYGTQGLTFTE